MSITVEFRDGVFAPLHEVEEPTSGEVYRLFCETELKQLAADVPRLRGSERSFEFWENEEDAIYDSPWTGRHRSRLARLHRSHIIEETPRADPLPGFP